MARRIAITALIVAAAFVSGARAAPRPDGVSATSPPRLLVTGREFSLTLSRATIAPGRAIVQFVNSGEDLHDLVIRRTGGSRSFRSGVTSPGEVAQFTAPLKVGPRYVLFCSLANHRFIGMKAHLQVADGS
jgi:plastocyanin